MTNGITARSRRVAAARALGRLRATSPGSRPQPSTPALKDVQKMPLVAELELKSSDSSQEEIITPGIRCVAASFVRIVDLKLAIEVSLLYT